LGAVDTMASSSEAEEARCCSGVVDTIASFSEAEERSARAASTSLLSLSLLAAISRFSRTLWVAVVSRELVRVAAGELLCPLGGILGRNVVKDAFEDNFLRWLGLEEKRSRIMAPTIKTT
jgi:hypothetical protein